MGCRCNLNVLKMRWRLFVWSLMVMLTAFFTGYVASCILIERQEDAYLVRDVMPQAIDAASNDDITIGNRTRLYVEEYFLDDGHVTGETVEMPLSLLGVSRDVLLYLLQDYMLEPDHGEKARGLLAVELMEFNENNVTVRKTFSSKNLPESFYLMEMDGMVVVMLKDKITVYDSTDIKVTALPAQFREKLAEGVEISSGNELYDFLETFTS